ncbi:hypothetical protein C8F01DRAFT_1264314 [Mycena amicta]|nr:hypothetical protein C8F01DRAFT_1264314 [Mycena amicta]
MPFKRAHSTDGSFRQHRRQTTQQRKAVHQQASRNYYEKNQKKILESRRAKRQNPVPTTYPDDATSARTPEQEPPPPPPPPLPPTPMPDDAVDVAAQMLLALAVEIHSSDSRVCAQQPSSAPTHSLGSFSSVNPSLERNTAELPPGVTPVSDEQLEALRSYGWFVLSKVQQHQLEVWELNNSRVPLTPPSDDESRHWVRADFGSPQVSPARLHSIIAWWDVVTETPAWHRIPGVRRFRPVFRDTVQWESQDPRLSRLDHFPKLMKVYAEKYTEAYGPIKWDTRLGQFPIWA